jgi:serine/threonine protein kinase/tetratricopeptide (TPR) repeat protein
MKNNPERDYRLMAVVATALQQPSEQRQSFLQAACHDDLELYQEATETLEWEERMGNFLLEPLLIFKDLERPFQPGAVISERFEIVREIGEGGMGVVYEAWDRKRNQRIAIKSAKAGFRRLLTPELESALQVRHPNICLVNEIHSATTAHGEVDFLTMEFLDGQSLSSELSSGVKFSQKEALEIARQLCAGLAEAHRSGVVHRDLKSANVILCRSEDGKIRAVITDFGLASADMISSSALAGTPRYMAPELWQGEPPSKASDLYALGVILYELVTGYQPFTGDEEPAGRTALSRPIPPSEYAEDLDRRWDAAILSCLDPSPHARLRDADEVLARLQKKPARKTPFIAVGLLLILVLASLIPGVRQPLLEHLRPAKVRLAILPAAGPEDTTTIGESVLQNVSEHLRRLRSGSAMIAVTSPMDMLNQNVHTAGQAQNLLHATHVLQVTFSRDGNDLEAKAVVIDLATQAHLREFSARYAPQIIDDMPKALTGVVSLALRLQGDTASDAISPKAKPAYDQALDLVKRSGYDEAASLFKAASLLDPHSSWPLAGLADAQCRKFYVSKQQGDLEEARQSLSRAEALNPDSVPVHLAAGLLNQTVGQYGKALEDYQRALEIEPRNVVALLRSAAMYDSQNMPDKAIEDYQKAISFEPGSAKPYQQLGTFYYDHGNYLSAAEQFQKAADRDHQLVDAYINLGAAMNNLGREAEAEQALLTSLTIRETDFALSNLGAIRAQQGRDAEAAGYYRRAVAMEPGNYIDWLNLGACERRLGHSAEAYVAFRKVKDLTLVELRQNPHNGHLRAFLAYAEVRLDHKAAAEEEISEALHSATGNSQVIHSAVLIYEALGQRDRAISALSGSTAESLREIDHDRDLAQFRQDPRFLQLVAKAQEGGH